MCYEIFVANVAARTAFSRHKRPNANFFVPTAAFNRIPTLFRLNFQFSKTREQCPNAFGVLEHVEIFLPRRKQENFIFGKANFAVGCGRSGEKFNAAENKIFRLQPGKEKLNML